ncbi:hypothetical protein CDAR_13541 [Caerostris darwini]|uniref:Uncharacterized protein n=1 Tax=Caerostris darwini TaxID=1538125 RepID=A0AAV4UDX2_9ARAC|nr:hypothetical protein CDAR_13541 [Caerostris darwini]
MDASEFLSEDFAISRKQCHQVKFSYRLAAPLKQVDTLHGKWATRKRLVKPSSIGIHPIEDQLKRGFEKCEGQNSLTFVCEPQSLTCLQEKQRIIKNNKIALEVTGNPNLKVIGGGRKRSLIGSVTS